MQSESVLDAATLEAVVATEQAEKAPDTAPDIFATVEESTAVTSDASTVASVTVVDDAPNSVDTLAEATIDTSGIGDDGRAVNDPRVAPMPVAQVMVASLNLMLFSEVVAPDAMAIVPNSPRAANDPRGPKSGDSSVTQSEADEATTSSDIAADA